MVAKQPQKEVIHKQTYMFNYIWEHHPSVQMQLCPIYNLRLKPYDFRDAEWIPESSVCDY